MDHVEYAARMHKERTPSRWRKVNCQKSGNTRSGNNNKVKEVQSKDNIKK